MKIDDVPIGSVFSQDQAAAPLFSLAPLQYDYEEQANHRDSGSVQLHEFEASSLGVQEDSCSV